MSESRCRTIRMDNKETYIIYSEENTCGKCKMLKTFTYPWSIPYLYEPISIYYCKLFSRLAQDPTNSREFGALPEPLDCHENGKPIRHSVCIQKEVKKDVSC